MKETTSKTVRLISINSKSGLSSPCLYIDLIAKADYNRVLTILVLPCGNIRQI